MIVVFLFLIVTEAQVYSLSKGRTGNVNWHPTTPVGLARIASR